MKRNTKGFTLVELIATIVILGLIAAVIIVNVTSISKKSTDKEYESFRETVLSAAQTYTSKETEIFGSLFKDRSYIYFTVGDLIEAGYLRDNIINPYTKEVIDPNGRIKAVLDPTTGAIRLDYPAEDVATEQSLVAMMDYVVNGEPYDCMTGIGTYKLALSDEDGVLITDVETLFNEYKLTCTYDPRMQTWTNSSIYEVNQVIYGDKDNRIKYSNDAGDYTITYNWITKSGTRMTGTRQLRVLEKFEPSIELRTVSVTYPGNGHAPTITAEQFDAGSPYESFDRVTGGEKIYNLYSPVYSDNKWTILAFRPILNGADLDNTTFTIKKNMYKESANYKTISNSSTIISNNESYDKIYVVDDGDTEYTVSTTTGGHYFKKYKLTNSAKIVVKQDIAINNSFITTVGGAYNTEKVFNLKDTDSPSGIKEYEFAVGALPSGGRSAKPSASVFNRTGEVTAYTFNGLANSSCTFSDRTYENIYFRPINNDGYFGSWTQVALNFTNNLSNLIDNNVGTNCANSCSTQVPSSSTSIGSLSCYYCAKNKYVSYDGKKFVVLGKKGTQIVIADNDSYLGDISGADITTIVNDVYGVQTVDGYYEKEYSYTNTAPQSLFNKAGLFETTILKPGYNRVFAQLSFNTDNQGAYLGYSAIPTESDITLFGSALDGEYWIAKNGVSSSFDVTVLENVTTTKNNYYWYYHKADGTLDITTGGIHPLKTIHIIDKGYVCSGDGSFDNPYVISMNN